MGIERHVAAGWVACLVTGCLRVESQAGADAGVSEPADAAVMIDASATSLMELITAGAWKRTALVSRPAYDWNANGTPAIDVLAIMPPCEHNDAFTFISGGWMTADEGATSCKTEDPQKRWERWYFAEQHTRLVFNGTDTYTLLELTASTLKLESTFVEAGVTYTHIETYGH